MIRDDVATSRIRMACGTVMLVFVCIGCATKKDLEAASARHHADIRRLQQRDSTHERRVEVLGRSLERTSTDLTEFGDKQRSANAQQGKAIVALRDSYAGISSDLAALSRQQADTRGDLDRLEKEAISRLSTAEERIEGIHDAMAEREVPVLEVRNDTLLRASPSASEEMNVLADIPRSAYVKKLASGEGGGGQEWYHVVVFVDGFPIRGYVSADSVKETAVPIERYTAAAQNAVTFYHWQNVIVHKLKQSNLGSVGVFLAEECGQGVFLYVFQKELLETGIEIKRIDEFDPEAVTELCRKHEVDALLRVATPIDGNNQMAVMELFRYDGTLLAVSFLDLDRVRVSKDQATGSP